MKEPTKIDFHHRRISRISDFTELMEMLFPGNRNQRRAAACIFLELKWASRMVPNLAYIEERYDLSRRTVQRTRAKLSRLGLVEHVSHLNTRYSGQHGWRLSARFEGALNQLRSKCADFKSNSMSSQEKELLLLEFSSTRRTLTALDSRDTHRQKQDGGEII